MPFTHAGLAQRSVSFSCDKAEPCRPGILLQQRKLSVSGLRIVRLEVDLSVCQAAFELDCAESKSLCLRRRLLNTLDRQPRSSRCFQPSLKNGRVKANSRVLTFLAKGFRTIQSPSSISQLSLQQEYGANDEMCCSLVVRHFIGPKQFRGGLGILE